MFNSKRVIFEEEALEYDKGKELLQLFIGKNFSGLNLKFEVISHRFTKRAKENILDVFPKTILPMEEEIRKFKYGQFGYGKYLYNNEELKEMKNFFRKSILKYFSEESINYLV